MNKDPAFTGLNCVHRKRIERFEKAVRAHEMKGSKYPLEHEAIEAEYEDAKAALAQTFRHFYKRQS